MLLRSSQELGLFTSITFLKLVILIRSFLNSLNIQMNKSCKPNDSI